MSARTKEGIDISQRFRRVGRDSDHILFERLLALSKHAGRYLTYDGQHMTFVLDSERIAVAAVVKAAGHTIGCMLRVVNPSGF